MKYILTAMLLIAIATGAQAGSWGDRVAASGDDGYYTSGLGALSTGAAVSYWGMSGAFEQRAFSRWDNITVPNGATIDSVILTIKAASSFTNTPGVRMRLAAADDALSPADSADWSTDWAAGTGIDTVASWDNWTAFTWYRIDIDLSDEVQEITDRAGWSSGNAIVLLIEGYTSSVQRSTCAYDHASTGGDSLAIFYTEAASGGVRVMLRK